MLEMELKSSIFYVFTQARFNSRMFPVLSLILANTLYSCFIAIPAGCHV
jgi:hypothetical protein